MLLLAPDAPGDSQFVDTSLSPEHIQLHESPRSSLLGQVDPPHFC